tara:strand:- start:1624 stop:1869 length:246 start_codon:yes stop_codon:yes gene_type:complete
MSNKLIATGFAISGALYFAFWLGGEAERMKQELIAAQIESKCYAKDKFEAFVAKDGVDYACFKQNIETKKISKSLIVLEGN